MYVEDLKSTDIHTVRSLREIADGRVPHVNAVELITQALISSSISPKGGVLMSHPIASSVALKSFISPSDSYNIGDKNEKNERNQTNGITNVLPVDIDGPSSSSSPSPSSSDFNIVKITDESVKRIRVKAVCDLLLQDHLTQHRSGMDHFLKGIASVLPVEIFPIFTSTELKTIFCGQDEVDIDVLKRATVYEGGVGPTDRYTIRSDRILVFLYIFFI